MQLDIAILSVLNGIYQPTLLMTSHDRYGRCGLIKQTVDSRIIIDCEAHNRFLPNEAVSFAVLGKADGEKIDAEDDAITIDSDEDSTEYISTPSEGDAVGAMPSTALSRPRSS